jgi:hypothetical protein
MESKREFGQDFWEILGSMPDFQRPKGKRTKRSGCVGTPEPVVAKLKVPEKPSPGMARNRI